MNEKEDYRRQIIEMIEKIQDENVLLYFYIFIKGKVSGYFEKEKPK